MLIVHTHRLWQVDVPTQAAMSRLGGRFSERLADVASNERAPTDSSPPAEQHCVRVSTWCCHSCDVLLRHGL